MVAWITYVIDACLPRSCDTTIWSLGSSCIDYVAQKLIKKYLEAYEANVNQFFFNLSILYEWITYVIHAITAGLSCAVWSPVYFKRCQSIWNNVTSEEKWSACLTNLLNILFYLIWETLLTLYWKPRKIGRDFMVFII